MTEWQIQNALWRDMQGHCLVACPNYAPGHWWECDLFSVTKAGYMHEHEIKVTVADFKRDAMKAKTSYPYRLYKTDGTKHELLGKGANHGPSRFWYVVPEGMITADNVPTWAGLKTVAAHPHRKSHLIVTEVKKAPQLHKEKVSADVLKHVASVFYYRFWRLRSRSSDAAIEASEGTK